MPGKGDERDEVDDGGRDAWTARHFAFPRRLQIDEVENGDTVTGTFDGEVHHAVAFTQERAFEPNVRLTFTGDPVDNVSPHAALLLFRQRDGAAGDDPREVWEPVTESRDGFDGAISLHYLDVHPAGRYLVVMVPSDYTEEEGVGYALSVLTDRDLPCSRSGVVEESGAFHGTGSAIQDRQWFAYYSARDAARHDLEAKFTDLQNRCARSVDLDPDTGDVTVRALSYLSGNQWVVSIAVPEPVYLHDHEWTEIGDDDGVEGCSEVEPSRYSRRFECQEEATLEWACCRVGGPDSDTN